MVASKEASAATKDEKTLKRSREESSTPEPDGNVDSDSDVKCSKKVKPNDDKEKVEDGAQEKNAKHEHSLQEKKVEEANLDDKKTNTDDKDENNSSKESSGFVFGASSAFGAGFKMAKQTPALEEKDNKESSSSKPVAFGSGLSFGGGFGVLKKEEEKEHSEPKDEVKVDKVKQVDDKKEDTADLEKTSEEPNATKLEMQEVKSGEESEELLYQVNAKLYQLSDIKTGWKERGVGIIKINENKDTGKIRLLMRSRVLLKVLLNLPLLKQFSIHKGFPGSLQSEKFVRILAVDDHNSPTQYALRTGKEETAQELYDNLVKLVPK